jgi:hypothetical protein
MATKIIDNNGIVSFDSISSEEDLKLRPRISINPPPAKGRCECCGRHISELEPFGISYIGYSLSFLIRKWIIKFSRKLQIGEK